MEDTPIVEVWTVENVEYLLECLDQLIIINQAMIYILFVILGGLVALAFFSFWKRIFG